MNKVEIPKEVADAIKHIRSIDIDDYSLLCGILGNANSPNFITIKAFTNDNNNFDTLLQALVNGYTVKQEDITVTITPEQQKSLKEYYSKQVTGFGNGGYDSAHVGVLRTMDALGIKIEGVN